MWGGGVNTVLVGKKAFSQRQKTWSLARMKLAIFSIFGCRQVTVKVRFWEQCPPMLAGKAQKNAKYDRLCSYTGEYSGIIKFGDDIGDNADLGQT